MSVLTTFAELIYFRFREPTTLNPLLQYGQLTFSSLRTLRFPLHQLQVDISQLLPSDIRPLRGIIPGYLWAGKSGGFWAFCGGSSNIVKDRFMAVYRARTISISTKLLLEGRKSTPSRQKIIMAVGDDGFFVNNFFFFRFNINLSVNEISAYFNAKIYLKIA